MEPCHLRPASGLRAGAAPTVVVSRVRAVDATEAAAWPASHLRSSWWHCTAGMPAMHRLELWPGGRAHPRDGQPGVAWN
jgi:hypothetical protein